MSGVPDNKTKAIPVNGDITPISHEPIEQVDLADWGNMSTADLVDQRRIVQNRYWTAVEMGQTAMAAQIQQGIDRLTKIIDSKSGDSGAIAIL